MCVDGKEGNGKSGKGKSKMNVPFEPYYKDDHCTIYNADCRQVLDALPDDSIDLIATDPPYYKVKADWWDRQWEKPEAFLDWMGELCDKWRRVLKPNGSLYVFASPQMSHRVESVVAERFNVLTNIRWRKPEFSTKAEMFDKTQLRSPFPASESIIFAEHYNSDTIAKGQAGYASKCDELRGDVFEPLRAYLAGERDRAGFTTREVAERYQKKTGSRTVTRMAGHWFERVQWALPTEENYAWLRGVFGPKYLRREYEELRREYEELRREYEELRRPFFASPKRPYTDVWDFPTVQDYKGKHPCEKPLAMMEHIIQTSSREGDIVLDCFGGSCVTARAARNFGRKSVICEIEEKWCKRAKERLRQGRLIA